MSGRRTQIIAAAMRLFAHKGYHATSMQEIAESSGLAKGSLYNYFKSKEEIAISIFKQHYELLFGKIAQIMRDDTLSAKEKFVKQLTVQIEEVYRHKEFIQMQIMEQAVKINDKVQRLVFRIRAETLHWYANALIDIYGERIQPFALDCATILNGMLSEYLFYIAIDKKEIPAERLVPFLIKRLDAMVESICEQEHPILNEEIMNDYLVFGKCRRERTRQEIVKLIDEFIEKLENIHEENRLNHNLYHSLNTIKGELETHEQAPRKFIIDALLLYLGTLEGEELRSLVERLKEKIDFYFSL